jgi:hypothetical protein
MLMIQTHAIPFKANGLKDMKILSIFNGTYGAIIYRTTTPKLHKEGPLDFFLFINEPAPRPHILYRLPIIRDRTNALMLLFQADAPYLY